MDPKKRAERAGLIWVGLFAVTWLCALVTWQGGEALQSRPWLVVLALLAAANVPVLLHARHLSTSWRATTTTSRDDLRSRGRRALPKASKRAIQLWTLGLIAWLAVLLVLLPATVTASVVGDHHGVAAVTAVRVIPHYRAPTEVFVEFTTSQGQLVSTKLRGAEQDERAYKPGLVVYYESSHPEVAIARADYDDGNALGLPVMAVATVIFGLWSFVTFRFMRRRGLSA